MQCKTKLENIAGKAYAKKDKCIDDFQKDQDLLDWLKEDSKNGLIDHSGNVTELHSNNVIIQVNDELLCFSRTRFISSGYPFLLDVVNTKNRTIEKYRVIEMSDPLFRNPIVPIYVPYEMYKLLFDGEKCFFNFTLSKLGSNFVWNICAFTEEEFSLERDFIDLQLL